MVLVKIFNIFKLNFYSKREMGTDVADSGNDHSETI